MPVVIRRKALKSRTVASVGALALLVVSALWTACAFMFVAYRIGDYCEDAGVCFEGAPVRAGAQAVVALVGIVAALQLASHAFRYASTAEVRSGTPRLTVVAGACALVWLVVAATLL